MSYCRWSSDDFQCDVYVYKHVGGFWQIHVATNRSTPDEPFPEAIVPKTDEEWDKFFEREKVVREMLDKATSKEIGLKYDGEDFQCPSAKECASVLMMLKNEGYNVPDYAINDLLEEEE